MTKENYMVVSWFDETLQMFQVTRVNIPILHGAKTFRIDAIYTDHMHAEEHAHNIRVANKLQLLKPTTTTRIVRPVICEQTLQRYPSIASAATLLKIDRAALQRHLKGEPGYKTVKGFTFAYLS